MAARPVDYRRIGRRRCVCSIDSSSRGNGDRTGRSEGTSHRCRPSVSFIRCRPNNTKGATFLSFLHQLSRRRTDRDGREWAYEGKEKKAIEENRMRKRERRRSRKRRRIRRRKIRNMSCSQLGGKRWLIDKLLAPPPASRRQDEKPVGCRLFFSSCVWVCEYVCVCVSMCVLRPPLLGHSSFLPSPKGL